MPTRNRARRFPPGAPRPPSRRTNRQSCGLSTPGAVLFTFKPTIVERLLMAIAAIGAPASNVRDQSLAAVAELSSLVSSRLIRPGCENFRQMAVSYFAKCPPSAIRTVPVINDARLLKRKEMVSAISSALP